MKKNSIYLFIAIVALAFQSCKKTSPGDNYDFSNSLPPYVTLTSKAISVAAGKPTGAVAINMRTGLEQAVTVTYNVTGIISASNQTLTIPVEATTASATLTRPTTGTTTGTATLTIVKATKADGTALTIGQNNIASQQVAVVTF